MASDRVLVDRDLSIRLYDETTATPKYQLWQFRGNFSGPMGRPRAEETLMISNGKAETTITHFRVLTDRKIYEPLEFSIGGKLYDNEVTTGIIPFLSNPTDESSWTALSTSLTGVTTMGATVNSDGTSVTHPAPLDAQRVAHRVNVEILWDTDNTDWGVKYAGVYFEPDKLELSSDEEGESTWSDTGTIFGGITRLTAHTLGVAVT